MIEILLPPIQAILQPSESNDQKFKTYAVFPLNFIPKLIFEFVTKNIAALFHLNKTICRLNQKPVKNLEFIETYKIKN